MKKHTIMWIIFIAMTMLSCSSLRLPQRSQFTENPPQMGIDVQSFLTYYGTPTRRNMFRDEDGAPCEELIYREVVELDGTWYALGDIRAINSIFLFRNGKLVSQFQEDDITFQEERARANERRLFEERLETEKKRLAVEQEHLEIEKKKKQED